MGGTVGPPPGRLFEGWISNRTLPLAGILAPLKIELLGILLVKRLGDSKRFDLCTCTPRDVSRCRKKSKRLKRLADSESGIDFPMSNREIK